MQATDVEGAYQVHRVQGLVLVMNFKDLTCAPAVDQQHLLGLDNDEFSALLTVAINCFLVLQLRQNPCMS